jgi:hypothetical protein
MSKQRLFNKAMAFHVALKCISIKTTTHNAMKALCIPLNTNPGSIYFPEMDSEEIRRMFDAMPPTNDNTEAYHHISWFLRTSKYFHFVETFEGYIGLTPRETTAGDVIGYLQGCESLFVLRKADEKYAILGRCHMVGLMNGSIEELCAMGKGKV